MCMRTYNASTATAAAWLRSRITAAPEHRRTLAERAHVGTAALASPPSSHRFSRPTPSRLPRFNPLPRCDAQKPPGVAGIAGTGSACASDQKGRPLWMVVAWHQSIVGMSAIPVADSVAQHRGFFRHEALHGMGFINSFFNYARDSRGFRKRLIEMRPVVDTDGATDEVKESAPPLLCAHAHLLTLSRNSRAILSTATASRLLPPSPTTSRPPDPGLALCSRPCVRARPKILQLRRQRHRRRGHPRMGRAAADGAAGGGAGRALGDPDHAG